MASSQEKSISSSIGTDELSSEKTLGLVSLSLMQKLSQKDPTFSWLIDENSESKNLNNLRNRLELTELAIKTGAPLSTTEVSILMGAKPGKSKVERGGLLATKSQEMFGKLLRLTMKIIIGEIKITIFLD